MTERTRRKPGDSGPGYEVIAVRYGTRETTRAESFHCYEIYGEDDAPLTMDYFFWLLRDPHGQTIVVDSGFDTEVGEERGRTVVVEPAAAMRSLGVDPETVRTVVVTHLHYDHIGNLELFPEARLVVARKDLEFWTGPVADRRFFADLVVPSELEVVTRAASAGRVRLVDDDLIIAPGVRVLRVGGHSPGQLIVVVDTAHGQCVLASDAIHYAEELDRDMPFALFTELADMYRGYDVLRELRDGGRMIVPGHDPAVMERFERVPDAGGLAVTVSSPRERTEHAHMGQTTGETDGDR